jgi:hypothetical protein
MRPLPPRPHSLPTTSLHPRVSQVHGRIFVAIARARVSEVYSEVIASKKHLVPAAVALQSDSSRGDHAHGADGAAAAGGGDAAHKAAANFIESQRLEKGVGSDEEVR